MSARKVFYILQYNFGLHAWKATDSVHTFSNWIDRYWFKMSKLQNN